MKSVADMAEHNQNDPLSRENVEPVGTLIDFVDGATDNKPLHVEIGLNTHGRVVVFHDKPFKQPLGWYEYNLKNASLDFVMDDGEKRNMGIKIDPRIGKNMQNTHQILTVLMDDESGQAKKGQYVPVILHQE